MNEQRNPDASSAGKATKRGRTRKERERQDLDALIKQLRELPGCERAVDLLVEPIARARKLDAVDPAYTWRTIVEWAKDFPDNVLKAARFKVLERQFDTVWEDHITEAVRDACGLHGHPRPLSRPGAKPGVGGVLLSVAENPEQWGAWERYFDKAGEDRSAPASVQHRVNLQLMRNQRAFLAPTEWPPASAEATA